MAAHAHTTPRAEPEVLAANVRSMLAPFFRGDIGPAPVINQPTNGKPAPAARAMVLA